MTNPGSFFNPIVIFNGAATTSTSFIYGTPINGVNGDGWDMGTCNWLSLLVNMSLDTGTAQLKFEWSTTQTASGIWYPESFRDYNNVMGTAVAADADTVGADVPSYPRYEHFVTTGLARRTFLFPMKANYFRVGIKVGVGGSASPLVIAQRLVL